jgi:hypothetical protein
LARPCTCTYKRLLTGDWRGLKEGQVPQSVANFNDFLGTLPHKHKIVIAGTITTANVK